MKGSQGSFASLFPSAAAAVCAAALGATALAAPLGAQGVTTASVTGRLTGPGGAPVEGARVTAVHLPSGTTYNATTRADGRYTILGMRVGGPYRVTARALGFEPQVREGVSLSLGTAADLSFSTTQVATQLSTVTVTAQTTGTISSTRTGAATAVSREAIQTLPTISRTIGDFTRLTPQASGTSFAGQDNRLNNITVDGSFFNNSFGLSGQPGGRTGVAPIPLDAIDQVQVNVAPYDVRQGNFVGAGVNAVTRSGTNEFEGSVYYFDRNEDYVGRFADVSRFNPGTFTFSQIGARLGGPILRNRLFFFANFEDDQRAEPGTTFLTRSTPTEQIIGNTTRVLTSDLTQLQSFLADNFQYQTGPFAGYSNATPSRRFIGKLDYNVSERHKASLRYIQLDSKSDNLVSNSSSLGFGDRRTNQNAVSFENSGYAVLENIRSLVGEVNSQFGGRVSNNFIVGYTTNDESRESKGAFFPTVDVLQGGLTYTSFGFEPFTPNNELRYNTFQIQNNLSVFTARHELTFGVAAQRYRSENVFFPGSQSVYVYNSLEDFYTDANDFLANPSRTTSPVTLNRFQVRYNNIPGQEKPVQPLSVLYAGAYAQDEWRATDRLRLTLGLRVDVPRFENTGIRNAAAEALSFRDENGNSVQYRTDKLPNANPLFSPRLGLNWDVRGDRSTQVRGGTGIFTGSPAYVWISNQIGENGVLTGFERLDNTRARPFNPDPNAYKPATVTGAPASRYQLALTDPDYRFPQLWRSNLAVDQRLPFGLVATIEGLYGRDVNGTYYINANLDVPDAQFTGVDQRPRWTSTDTSRINNNIDNAIVLKNQNVGTSWNVAGSLEKAFRSGLFAKAAYSYGEARNTVDPGSIAFGSWNGNPHAGDPNNPGLGYSSNSPGHRAFVTLAYKGRFLPVGETGISLFAESRTIGNTSYTFSGDLNGDGGTSNDLIYIPRDRSEMNFEQFTINAGRPNERTFTAAQQADAWEAYIQQDKYLRENRGRYAERGAVFLPRVLRTDVSVTQDISRAIFGRRNAVQLRLDILNAGNLIARDWGVSQRLVTNTPLIARGADANGAARYRLRNFGTSLLAPQTFERTAGLGDVYQFQIGARYTFGN